MHPFMPFVTEEIWQALTDCESAVVTAEYPDYQSVLDFGQTAEEFSHVLEALQAVRRSRKALHIPQNVRAKFFFDTLDIEIFSASSIFFEYLCGAKEISFVSDCCFRNAIDVVTDRARISIPLEQQLIQDREHMRLMEEAEHLRQKADRLKALLHNPDFCSRAPESVVREAREQRSVIRERLLRIVTALGNR
jgi:valyl-tRNA synthetase